MSASKVSEESSSKKAVDGYEIGGYKFSRPDPWNLPVLPRTIINDLPAKKVPTSYKKRIPRNLWISFTKAPLMEELSQNYSHLDRLLKRNGQWNVYFGDTEMRHKFMEKYFADTSMLWVFKLINSQLGVIQSDMWR
jgi:hypothetical protein